MTTNLFHKPTNHPIKSEQSVEAPLNRHLSSLAPVKSSAKFFVILAILVSIIGCGDGLTGQAGGEEPVTVTRLFECSLFRPAPINVIPYQLQQPITWIIVIIFC